MAFCQTMRVRARTPKFAEWHYGNARRVVMPICKATEIVDSFKALGVEIFSVQGRCVHGTPRIRYRARRGGCPIGVAVFAEDGGKMVHHHRRKYKALMETSAKCVSTGMNACALLRHLSMNDASMADCTKASYDLVAAWWAL